MYQARILTRFAPMSTRGDGDRHSAASARAADPVEAVTAGVATHRATGATDEPAQAVGAEADDDNAAAPAADAAAAMSAVNVRARAALWRGVCVWLGGWVCCVVCVGIVRSCAVRRWAVNFGARGAHTTAVDDGNGRSTLRFKSSGMHVSGKRSQTEPVRRVVSQLRPLLRLKLAPPRTLLRRKLRRLGPSLGAPIVPRVRASGRFSQAVRGVRGPTVLSHPCVCESDLCF